MKKNAKKWIAAALATVATVSLTACGGSADTKETTADSGATTVVKVGVVGEYNAQWDTINELLADDGIQVELVKFTDYAAPNRALNDGEIDLNAFQHKAFLANDIQQKGYDIVDIGDTIIAPLGIYNNKDKISSIEDIKDGDVIAIPSDLTNGGRALKLLETAGIIECDPAKGVVPTKADITKYNKQIEIIEAESATLANILPDCAAAIINGGNAFTAGLNPVTDTIFVEDVNPETNAAVPDLVNVIVARTEDKDNEVYKKIVEAYQTPEVQKTIEDEYQGAFVCAWEGAAE
ncbi:MetQ/NlpA family ABC transporter substrate-binding protein [Anaerotignum sp.]|uniref:MetQ/NlpA family ABC transporter substrate-binding protein n=1 Tax=Anaerotignum sp. TaxID=2039241 RepID=UPI002A917E02|nr:MetQ/NlpA family ABC transporter substrate-binding protein [Anaerotignum sp.]MCI7657198.1 MetQ/NlpA family ABC transporter substrate-binding protein [Clostridia bacterium]MDY5415605.1 MetQ/NlpA family ABC transporter substrate-binding protein [Anaerotignum sp.]